MRDGVKLKTFILVPKGASGAPMLLTRTPYNASEQRRALCESAPRIRRAADVRHRGRRRLHHRDPGRARKVRLRGRLRHDAAAARSATTRRRPTMPRIPTTRSTGSSRTCPRATAASARSAVPMTGYTTLMSTSIRTRRSRSRCRSRRWWTAGWATTGSTTAPSGRTARSQYTYEQEATPQERAEVVVRQLRHLRRFPARGLSRRNGGLSRPRAARVSGASSPSTRATTLLAVPGGGQGAREGTAQRPDADRVRPVRPGRHLRRARAFTRRSRRRIRRASTSTSCSAPGTTGRAAARAAASAWFSSRATPPAGSGAR